MTARKKNAGTAGAEHDTASPTPPKPPVDAHTKALAAASEAQRAVSQAIDRAAVEVAAAHKVAQSAVAAAVRRRG
ncbi:hypothetical protein ACMGDH_16690 [Sphingomonas sp. DT-207]|uniref:hypothetical protein n=1 Tax=Sphingomonas sp. DT-207 TaxID=3396167 RepID=UPI003F196431